MHRHCFIALSAITFFASLAPAGVGPPTRLSAGGRARVLVLEAGDRDRHIAIKVPAGFRYAVDNPRLNWGYKTTPGDHTGARAIDEDSARDRASRLCCPRPSRATWPCMRTSRTPRPCTWPPSGSPKVPRWDVRCSASARCTGAAVSSSRPRSATARHWPKVTTRPSSAGRTRTSA